MWHCPLRCSGLCTPVRMAGWVELEQQMGPLPPERLSSGPGWPLGQTMPQRGVEGQLWSPHCPGTSQRFPCGPVPHGLGLPCPWVSPWEQWAVVMQVCEPEEEGWRLAGNIRDTAGLGEWGAEKAGSSVP